MDCNVNVCLAFDEQYSIHAGVAIASVLTNAAREDHLHFYILNRGISVERRQQIMQLRSIKDCSISFIDINDEMFADYTAIKTHSYITLPTYYRLKTASLLPEVDKIIYMDCDVVVTASLRELFDIQLGDDFLMAATRERLRKKSNERCFYSGLLLMDLRRWREEGLEEKFLGYVRLHRNSLKSGDQEIINKVCSDRIKTIGDEWNLVSVNIVNRSNYKVYPKIVHFGSRLKPWDDKCFSLHRRLYYKYRQITPWAMSREELDGVPHLVTWKFALMYFIHRPLFMFRPRFYVALFYYLTSDQSQYA